MLPPLTVTAAEIDEAVAILDGVLAIGVGGRGESVTMTMRVVVDNGPGRKRRASSGRALKAAQPQIALRPAVAADAPALHALIAAHLEEGHLLPRALDELTVHAPRFVVAVEPRRPAIASSAARSSRRCRRRWPKCARSSSAATRGASASACGWSTTWPRAPAAKASRACARSRTIRRSSSASASRSCRTPGCPRRSRTTATRARCSATAASTRSCSSSIATSSATSSLACERRERPSIRPCLISADRGRRHRAVRIPRQRACTAASRPAASRTSSLIVSDRAGDRRRRVHDESREGGAGVSSAQDHLASSDGIAQRDRHQQRLRQRLHGPAGHGRRARDGGS